MINKYRRGFSLVELLLIIGLATMIISTIFVIFEKLSNNAKLEKFNYMRDMSGYINMVDIKREMIIPMLLNINTVSALNESVLADIDNNVIRLELNLSFEKKNDENYILKHEKFFKDIGNYDLTNNNQMIMERELKRLKKDYEDLMFISNGADRNIKYNNSYDDYNYDNSSSQKNLEFKFLDPIN